MRGQALSRHRSSVIVTALSAAFGAGLIQATSYLAVIISGSEVIDHRTARFALGLVAGVLVVIAAYVGSIVTANTFATIIAGRTRTIALMRLLGSSAASLRRSVAREGLLVGVVGAGIGTATGIGLTAGGTQIAVAAGTVPALDYGSVDPLVSVSAAIVVLSTWAASWVGSRNVLRVTPLQATATAEGPTHEHVLDRPVRNMVAALMFFGGLIALALGIMLGQFSMLGFLVAFVGGIVSFSGVVIGAHVIIPRALRWGGRVFGHSAPARLAAENAMRYPERSSRTAIGLVIGVTLVTTFGVAAQGYTDMITRAATDYPQDYRDADQIVAVTLGVFTALIGFCAIIAALGMVNILSLSVIQRTREVGILRAIGFTRTQVRQMIVAESAQMTLAAVGLGLMLGAIYGWAGAQSLLGAILGSSGVVWPSIPWLLLVILAVGTMVLTFSAAQIAARKAVSMAPLAAIAMG